MKSKRTIPVRIVLSFLLVILLGSLLLSLPLSQASSSQASYFDHLFTAVSMVCVTGLFTQPVYLTYNLFGQIVCLLLIQIGGLGLMSIIALLFYKIGRRLSLVDRIALQESINQDDNTNFKGFLATIFRYTFTVEAIGALILAFRFVPKFGWFQGIFTSIFLAISAFCNAGFDNFGPNSLIDYAGDWLVCLPISLLIILGGLGFSVWFDLKQAYQSSKEAKKQGRSRSLWKRLHLHTKFVLFMTVTVTILGMVTTYLTELGNQATIGSKPLLDQLLISYFQSVTMRTAGFASIDYSQARPATLLLYDLLMFMGGSPGGTAGGVKLTTFMVVALYAISEIRNRTNTNLWNHTLSNDMIRKAIIIVLVYFLFTILGIFGLALTDPQAPLRSTLFETLSALCTVGVTANLTATLSRLGQTLLMALMIIGRTGPLTILVLFGKQSNRTVKEYKYTNAKLLIG